MTDNEFDTMFAKMTATDTDILKLLVKYVSSVQARRNDAGYVINSVDDLKAVIEQQMYEQLTGRE